MRNALVVMGLAVLVGLLAGCAPKPASIEVSPDGKVVNDKSEALVLEAKVLDEKGTRIPDAVVTFSSSDEAVASVGKDGALTVKGSGKVVITAAAGEVSGTADVVVELFDTLTVAEETVTLEQGATSKLSAEIKNEKGEKVDGELAWISADEAVATVDSTGAVTGVAVGTTEISVSAKALKANVKVEVKPAGPASLKALEETLELKVGATHKLEVSALDAAGAPMADVAVGFTSSDEAVATIDAEGTVTAVAAGTVTITAQAADKTAAVALTVKK